MPFFLPIPPVTSPGDRNAHMHFPFIPTSSPYLLPPLPLQQGGLRRPHRRALVSLHNSPLPPLCPNSKVACGVLIGVQEGGGVESGSTAAIGLNAGLLATKLLYAVYLTALRPQVGMPGNLPTAWPGSNSLFLRACDGPDPSRSLSGA